MALYLVSLPGSGLPPGPVRAETGKLALRNAIRAANYRRDYRWPWPTVKRIGP